MKVLVTGANGLLGQHLVKVLLENVFEVVATGRVLRVYQLTRVKIIIIMMRI